MNQIHAKDCDVSGYPNDGKDISYQRTVPQTKHRFYHNRKQNNN